MIQQGSASKYLAIIYVSAFLIATCGVFLPLIYLSPVYANPGGGTAGGNAGDGVGAERFNVKIKKSVYLSYSNKKLKKVAAELVKLYRPGFYTVQLEGLSKRESIAIMFIATLNPQIASRLLERLAKAKTEKKRIKIIADEVKRLKSHQKLAENLKQHAKARILGNIILALQEGTW